MNFFLVAQIRYMGRFFGGSSTFPKTALSAMRFRFCLLRFCRCTLDHSQLNFGIQNYLLILAILFIHVSFRKLASIVVFFLM